MGFLQGSLRVCRRVFEGFTGDRSEARDDGGGGRRLQTAGSPPMGEDPEAFRAHEEPLLLRGRWLLGFLEF